MAIKLTPLDIHHKEFRNSLRGYNPEEVDEFLDQVADEVERLFKENIDLSGKLEAAEAKVASYAEMERTLQNTMLAAQTSAEDIQSRAQGEADLLVRDAELKSKEMVQDALAERQRSQQELAKLRRVKDDFRARFRQQLETYLDDVAEPEDVEEGRRPRRAKAAGTLADETVGFDVTESPAEPDEASPATDKASDDGEPAKSTSKRIAPFKPDLDAATAAEGPESSRPAEGSTEPILTEESSSSGSVTSLSLGEVGGVPADDDMPELNVPEEFRFPRTHTLGERDDDLDIEEID
jgi:cell division initiation protein